MVSAAGRGHEKTTRFNIAWFSDLSDKSISTEEPDEKFEAVPPHTVDEVIPFDV